MFFIKNSDAGTGNVPKMGGTVCVLYCSKAVQLPQESTFVMYSSWYFSPPEDMKRNC